MKNNCVIEIYNIRADQNTRGALLELPMKTVMHEKSRVSSGICLQNFITSFSTVAAAQWAGRWSSGHRVVEAEGSSPCGDIYTNFFSTVLFISVFKA